MILGAVQAAKAAEKGKELARMGAASDKGAPKASSKRLRIEL